MNFVVLLRSAIYASRLYLNQYHKTHPERLAVNKEGGPKISGKIQKPCVPPPFLIFRCLMYKTYQTYLIEYYARYLSFLVIPSPGNVYIHPTANIDPTAMVRVPPH